MELMVYGDIGGWWDEAVLAVDIAEKLAAFPVTDDKLTVRINSYGGVTPEGLAIRNLLRSFAMKRKAINPSFTFETIVDGYAYSAASIIAMAGDKIIMNTGSIMMIHNAWLFTSGNAVELREIANYLDTVDGSIADVYSQRTGMKKNEVAALMNEETFFTAKEALAAKYADQVDEGVEANFKQFGEQSAFLSGLYAKKERNAYSKFMTERFAEKSCGRPPQNKDRMPVVVNGLYQAYQLKMLDLDLDTTKTAC